MSPCTFRLGKLLAALSLSLAFLQVGLGQDFSLGPLRDSEAIYGPGKLAGFELLNSDNQPDIIQRFIEAEAKEREALNQHTFKRDVILQTIGPNGEITGEYVRNSQFLFDDKGRRIERLFYHPPSTIREMRITREDIKDLAGGQLLGVDITEASKYQFKFIGTEVQNSRDLVAIDVTPLVQPNPNRMSERFFVGRIWIDSTSFQIVKTRGWVEPQGKQRFPMFETWREPFNAVLAFPVRTEADDILHFPQYDVHYRIKVRYYDYKLFACKVSIKDVDEGAPNQ